jgi:hypothetical protein
VSEPAGALRQSTGEWLEQAAVARPVEKSSRALMRCGFANAMTIDVEDYFQVEAFASTIDRSDWESLPRRVERNTERLLRILAESEVEATFFILGWVRSVIRSWCVGWWRKDTRWRAMAPAICG